MNSSICKRINKLKEKLQEKKFTIKDVILQSALQNAPQDGSMQYVDVLEGVIFDIVIKAEGEEFIKKEFKAKYKKVFNKDCSKGLMEIFEGAIVQEHGTVAVILDHDHSYNEAERLVAVSTGTEVESRTLKAEYIHSITAIDGAVIFDESGICYAIGVILDGDESIEGNSERGARFNSTLKYVKTCEESGKRALALVVSEDRNVDILATVM